MADPLTALRVAFALALITALLSWPRHGLIPRLRRLSRLTDRVLTEDALKHVYDSEYRGVDATLQSLAGGLSISSDRCVRLVARLAELGLITSQGATLRLSPAGREDALRVIRVHRLWESYLAERTGVEPVRWHAEAEVREHQTRPDAVAAIAASLNHPAFDPHGDPIPSARGHMPDRTGAPLPQMQVGQRVRVVHVEDEPAAVFAQLDAIGLRPGSELHVLEVTPNRVRFAVGEDRHVLASALAGNLTVTPVVAPPPGVEGRRSLASLAVGERGVIAGIGHGIRGIERRRLLDMGLTPGTPIDVEMTSPLGDPRAYQVRGTVVALRHGQAKQVMIEG